MADLTVSSNIDTLMQSANYAAALTLLGGTPAANLVWCGPSSGSAGAATFRALVEADMPDLSATYATVDGTNNLVAGKVVRFEVVGAGIGLPGSTTVGAAILGLANPVAIAFLRLNANASVDALSAADYKTALNISDYDPSNVNITNGSAVLSNLTTGNAVITGGSIPYSILTGAPAAFDPANPGNIGTGTAGTGTFTLLACSAGSAAAPAYTFQGHTGTGLYLDSNNFPNIAIAGVSEFAIATNFFVVHASTQFVWTVGAIGTGIDLTIFRAAANILGVGSAGGAIQLKSPDGTAYNITVANGGTIAVTAA